MDKNKHTYIDFVKNNWQILISPVIYYFTKLFAYYILTILVNEAMRGMGGSLRNYVSGQEAEVRGIIGGLSSLIGIVPLLPALKRETGRRNEQDIQYESDRHHDSDSQHETGRQYDSGSHHKSGSSVPLYISVPITITLAITSSIAINILFIRLHLTEASESYSRVAGRQYAVSLVIGLILYGIISPLAEEVVFRGIVYNGIRRNGSVPIAVLVSALLFGLFHGNIVQGAYGFLMGVLIAYTYERFSGFFHAFLFHAAANIAVYAVTGSEAAYSLIMTPYVCVVFILISTVMIWLMKRKKL